MGRIKESISIILTEKKSGDTMNNIEVWAVTSWCKRAEDKIFDNYY